MYRNLTSRPLVAVNSYNNWVKVIGNLNLEVFLNSFPNIYKLTNITQLRDFQYRLLHKRLLSNKELYKWKIKRSLQCNFCTEQDSIEHTLYYCENIQQNWQRWEKEINDLFGIRIKVDIEMILLNNFVGRAGHIINLMGLVLKQLTYHFKCLNKTITFRMYMNEIDFIEKTERYIAKNNSKIALHERKWEHKDLDK